MSLACSLLYQRLCIFDEVHDSVECFTLSICVGNLINFRALSENRRLLQNFPTMIAITNKSDARVFNVIDFCFGKSAIAMTKEK